ncbi:MAG: hypothetical protein R8J94_11740 [Acidimicrobiia bacterium]|nr:hypothetical protein [Acidimicrobiia bacterium]
MSDSNDAGAGPEGEDYIYRGESSTPQDGQPWNPPSQPPAGPPPATPYPTSPPPGFPPQQPPMGAPVPGLPEPAPKKKRWPWIVAAVVIFCGLPLGGCVALIGFGVNEINTRSDEVERTVDEFFEAVEADPMGASADALTDGLAPCMPTEALVAALSSLGPEVSWSGESTAFVERSGNSTFSSNADPETLFIDGRPGQSVALVTGILEADSGVSEAQVLLSKPVSLWRICTITTR